MKALAAFAKAAVKAELTVADPRPGNRQGELDLQVGGVDSLNAPPMDVLRPLLDSAGLAYRELHYTPTVDGGCVVVRGIPDPDAAPDAEPPEPPQPEEA